MRAKSCAFPVPLLPWICACAAIRGERDALALARHAPPLLLCAQSERIVMLSVPSLPFLSFPQLQRMAEGGEEEMQELGSQGEVARRVVGEGLARCLGDDHLPVAAAATDALAAFCRSPLGVVSWILGPKCVCASESVRFWGGAWATSTCEWLPPAVTDAPEAYCRSPLGSSLIFSSDQLYKLTRSSHSQVQQRVVEAALRLANQSQHAMSAVEKLDLLQPLVVELQGVAGMSEGGTEGGGASEEGGDALAALAACELVSEFTSSRVGAELLEPRIDEIHQALVQICTKASAQAPPAEGAAAAAAAARPAEASLQVGLDLLLPAALKCAARLTSPATPGVMAPLTLIQADEVAALFNSMCEAWGRSEEHVPTETVEGFFDALATYARSTHGTRLLLNPRRHVVSFVLKHAFGGCGPHTSLHTASLYALASIFGADRVEGSEPVQMVPVHATHSGISGVDEGGGGGAGGGGGEGMDLEVGDDGETKLKEVTFAAAAKAPGGPTLAVSADRRQEACLSLCLSALRKFALLCIVCWQQWWRGSGRQWSCVGTGVWCRWSQTRTAERHKAAMDWRHSCCVAMSTAAEAQHASISFNCTAQLAEAIPFGQAIYKAVRLAEAQVNGNDLLLPDYTIQVVPVNTSVSTTQAAASVVQTMLAERVVAAVGPMTSSQAHVLSAIHTQVQVPMVSYSATDPSLSAASYPFFTRTIRSDALEMQAIADLVTHFSWLEVITIYSDDDYGRNGVNQLAVLLDKASVDVVKSIAVPLDASLSDIIVRLLAAQKLESTVFILQLNLELIVPVLTAASEVGMMTPGYVWIATEGVVSELENLPELSTEGMIGTRIFVPPNPQLSEFERAWQADGNGNATNGGGAFDTTTLYVPFAYDSLSLIAHSIHALLYPNSSPPINAPPPAAYGNASDSGGGVNSTGRLAGAEAATGGLGAVAGGTNGGVVGLERWQAVQLPKGGGASTDLARLLENLGACVIGARVSA
ncbi:unnamed protein product [Closterium sp. Yama58-4]|nr:unnamed protein product [Closterium sp. Yama58-4]